MGWAGMGECVFVSVYHLSFVRLPPAGLLHATSGMQGGLIRVFHGLEVWVGDMLDRLGFDDDCWCFLGGLMEVSIWMALLVLVTSVLDEGALGLGLFN